MDLVSRALGSVSDRVQELSDSLWWATGATQDALAATGGFFVDTWFEVKA